VSAPTTAIVVCDREYVRRILDNLLDNAFKYGRPPVRVEVVAEAEHVSLSVLDAGRGVAEADREKAFERFHRIDTKNGRGLGLGLSVVRGLVESMDGVIRIDDAPGGGAAFRIRFPRSGPATPQGTLVEGTGQEVSAASATSRSVS
jgi:signal transduction histidine kinase